ncbi:radical SAM protein [Haloferula sargassicola]|uniref:PqqA peptide cyclase n=1 Tax=Haloferula sargassicola TaxID=490096 RepID=A0ABP9UQV7_9BACT
MIVVWRVTTGCNSACPFCAYDRRLRFPRNSASADEVRRLLEILAGYQREHDDPVLVSWLGGEPFLWPHLPALTLHAQHLGLRVSATTNGSTLGSPDVRRHVLDHYSELTISLDAPDEAHDELRSSPGLFLMLRSAVSALARQRAIEARPLKIRINTVLLWSTIDCFSELVDEVAEWGVDEVTFNLLGGRDRPDYYAINHPSLAQIERFSQRLPSLRKQAASVNMVIAGTPDYVHRMRSAVQGHPHAVDDCGPGENFLFIDERGSVSPCSFTTRTLGMPSSGIHDASDIARLRDRFANSRAALRPCVCDDCPSTQVFGKFAPIT